jgi:flavin-dependent dehydrogenase
MTEYDLAIVGAGPGGVHAAKWAAKKGLKVVLIEKRKDISKITRYCSEHLILDEGYNGDTILVDPKKGKITSTALGWEVDYKGKLFPCVHKYYYSPKGNPIHFAWPDNRPYAYKYDKGFLLQSLLEECLALGVTFQNETTGYDAIDSKGGVEIKCASRGKKFKIKAKKLVIADGVNTRLGQAMGFNASRGYMGVALCMATYMSGVKKYDPTEWVLWYGRCYGSNMAPIIGTGPAGHFEDWADVINLGSAVDLPVKAFDRFTKESPIADRFANAKIEERYCCSVKAYTPISKPYEGNTVIIGDSAAFVEVQGQGALSCGYKVADAVAKELEGEKGFEEYTTWWMDSFEFNDEGMLQVQQGYALIPTYTDDEVDYLFSLCSDVLLDGSFSQYKSSRMIWDAILRDPKRIERERPALYTKIKNVRANTLESSLKDG